MSPPRNSIADKLNRAQLAINNASKDSEIMALLAPYNYDQAALEKGRKLYLAAKRAVDAKQDALGRQRQATANKKTKQKEAYKTRQSFTKIARKTLDKAQQVRLGLIGRMPVAAASFLVSTQTIFDNARQDDIQPLLAERGYSRKKLDRESAKITAYAEANQAQKAAIGTTQRATQIQKQALAALQAWMTLFRETTRVALQDQSQLLEKLGFLARNGSTSARRRGRPKTNGTKPPADQDTST